MRVSLSTYGSRGGVAPAVGVAVRLRALGAEVRACVPPDCAAAEERDAPVAAGVMPNGVWR
jgi:vancomycin aglycone glucosyltransferase